MVERIGVDGESLTVASRDGSMVYACDGGIDPAGERHLPWCHAVVGELDGERVLDPRLDVICRDRRRRPVAYAFVDPVPGAHWIGVRQDGYAEIYEVLAGLPVRVAAVRGIDVQNDTAGVGGTPYDAAGRGAGPGGVGGAAGGG